MLLGAAVGGIVELGIQVVPQLMEGTSVQDLEVSLPKIAGAVTGGAVMGLTLGAGAVAGATSLGASAMLGAGGGLFGGQAGAYTEAATSELLQGSGWNGERVMNAAQENGLGDGRKMVIDAGTGAAAAVVGHGLTRMAQDAGILSGPRTGLAAPADIVQFDIHGERFLMPDGVPPLKIPTSAVDRFFSGTVTALWKLSQAMTEELVQRGTGWLFEQVEE